MTKFSADILIANGQFGEIVGSTGRHARAALDCEAMGFSLLAASFGSKGAAFVFMGAALVFLTAALAFMA
jgi:hypothetical protein